MLSQAAKTREELLALVKNAGVVGAGGAGFPAHAKLDTKADLVIANGAECEPLLKVDQSLMALEAGKLVRGLETAMAITGASRGVIATKAHYHEAVRGVEEAIQGHPGLSLHLMDSYYPAGDEKSLIFEVTGEVVRSAKLPSHYGCVVLNIGTLVNIAEAVEGLPVTGKLVTVCGDVPRPLTRRVPLGTPIRALIASTGSMADESSHCVMVGGPLMGKIQEDWDAPVIKTTGGLVVLPRNHPLIIQTGMTVERQVKLAMAVCCQCNMCTIMCPRYALGLKVEPHKAMRAIANGQGHLLGDATSVLACCSCNLCTHYACNFGLTPGTVMTNIKTALLKEGVRPVTEEEVRVDSHLDTKRIPLSRLIARMGLSPYKAPADYEPEPLKVSRVSLPLKQHIGQPAQPLVKQGDRVKKGQLLAAMPEGQLGAPVHASLTGVVEQVADSLIILKAQEGQN